MVTKRKKILICFQWNGYHIKERKKFEKITIGKLKIFQDSYTITSEKADYKMFSLKTLISCSNGRQFKAIAWGADESCAINNKVINSLLYCSGLLDEIFFGSRECETEIRYLWNWKLNCFISTQNKRWNVKEVKSNFFCCFAEIKAYWREADFKDLFRQVSEKGFQPFC